MKVPSVHCISHTPGAFAHIMRTLQNEPEPQESLRLFAKFNPQGSLRIYDFTLSGKVLTTQRSFQAGDLSADYYYEGET